TRFCPAPVLPVIYTLSLHDALPILVDSGTSVLVIEHHLAVMAHADWIIDLGPGAGHDGGQVVFEGTPADLVAARSTLTGKHLARSEEHTSELQSRENLVCRLLLEKK